MLNSSLSRVQETGRDYIQTQLEILMSDKLIIAGKEFDSRLIVGTGRYRTDQEMVDALEASGTNMVTVAIRRLDLENPGEKTILDHIYVQIKHIV